jgi:hypothetical protein
MYDTAAEPNLQTIPRVGCSTVTLRRSRRFWLTAPLALPERTVDKTTRPARFFGKATLHPKDGVEPCDRSNACIEIATTAAGMQDVASRWQRQMQLWNCECAVSNRVASLPKKMKLKGP